MQYLLWENMLQNGKAYPYDLKEIKKWLYKYYLWFI